MDLLFLRRLTLEQLPLVLADRLEIDAFAKLLHAKLVCGEVLMKAERASATVTGVTPSGRAAVALRGRQSRSGFGPRA